MKTFVLILFLILSFNAFAEEWYIRSDANGNDSGTDWNNAMPDLPANLRRGDVYYIADGTYGAHRFNDANSGTTLITVKKATVSDHGTDVGWSDDLGDGEALFKSNDTVWTFGPGVGNYVFNGQKGSGNTPRSYGFRLYSMATRNSAAALIAPDLGGLYSSTGNNNNIRFNYIELDWNNGTSAGTNGATRAVVWNTAQNNTGIHFNNCFIHHSSGFGIYAASMGSDYVVNNCFFENNGGAPNHHHETLWVTGVNGFTFSNNTIKDTKNGALTGWLMLGTVSNARIYNNVFTCSSPTACATGGNGIIATWDNNVYKNSNIEISNNTFANLPSSGNPAIYFYHSGGAVDSNVVARNNIYFTEKFSLVGVTTHTNAACGGGVACTGSNPQSGLQTGIFANFSAQDFRLVAPTQAGVVTAFTKDKLGIDRGADGVWDRGAYEYNNSSVPTPTPTPTPEPTPEPTPVPVEGETLLGSTEPTLQNLTDGVSVNYELGMRFFSTKKGSITAIRFYKGSSEKGVHIGKIFSSSGSLLASVTFTNETASKWQVQMLPSPLKIEANTEYVVSVNTSNAFYVSTNNGFATQLKSSSLSSSAGSNGVYGSVGVKPSNTYMQSNYYRDVVFVADAIAPAPTPVATELIVDNLVAGSQNAQVAFTGKWCKSQVSGSYGNASLYSCGTTVNTYTFKPTIVVAQKYDVYVRYSARSSRSKAVKTIVNSASGIVEKSINQTVNGNTWVLHGRYSFNVGSSGTISVSHSNTNGDASVDGVKLVPVP